MENLKKIREEGYQKAIGQMRACSTEQGFLAATTHIDNYRRIWGRDSCITGLAALVSGEPELIDTLRRSLETLAAHQSPRGKIPSNYDPEIDRVSYGSTVGRVDADLWFLIAGGAYWRHTGDDEFLERMLDRWEKTSFLLRAWEFNERGLIYVPLSADWADEFAHSGYILYDELLYLQAQRELSAIHRHRCGSPDHFLEQRIDRLVRLIRANYWFDSAGAPEDIYHEALYEKGRKAAPERKGSYWMPFFSPAGYGYQFDAFANSLAALFGVARDKHRDAVDDYIDTQVVHHDVMLLPAFDPPITPKDEKWGELHMMFNNKFRNEPYHYQNGGLWPMVTGFYAAALARHGKTDLAEQYLLGIHRANQRELDGRAWSFPEYLDGKEFAPGGASHMAWSAAAAVLVENYLQGKRLFEHETKDQPATG